MKVVAYKNGGGPEVLTLKEVDPPVLDDDQVLIKVTATTVNRIDLSRRRWGLYKWSECPLGMECSGKIVMIGTLVTGWKKDDEVCAILDGGYADFVAVPATNIISAPRNLNLAHAAALPRAACLIWHSLFVMNKITRGQKILIHGGAGGVGSLAIQIAKYHGCQVFATAGSKEKVQFCTSLGADVCINHKEENFSRRIYAETKSAGVNYILDSHGGNFFQKNLSSLAVGGKLIVIGYEYMEGLGTLNCQFLWRRHLQIMGLDLTTFSATDTQRILQLVKKEIWPLIENGSIVPRISKTCIFSDAAEAHRLMEKNVHLGKILLTPHP